MQDSSNDKSAQDPAAQKGSYIIEESEVRQFNEPLVPYARLDPAAHGRVICEELTPEEEAMANDPDVKPFAFVSDSADYVRRIRRDFRC
jgi:hypothetical protein